MANKSGRGSGFWLAIIGIIIGILGLVFDVFEIFAFRSIVSGNP